MIIAGFFLIVHTMVAVPQSKEILATARSYLGEHYIYGDDGEHGFDCSSFVQQVFRENGMALPRTSREQAQIGQKVRTREVRAGDLLFFAKQPGSHRVSHVAIVLDRNHIIHASRHAHRVVISKWDTRYFRNRLLAARRVKQN